MDKGLRLACLYGIRPHQLGLCGPTDNHKSSQIIIDYLSQKKTAEPKKVKQVLNQFLATSIYYRQIAELAQTKNVFKEEVIQAYWLGNDLLDRPNGFKLHHSYHVLAVGSLTKKSKLAPAEIDLCRISWGRVLAKQKNQLKVSYRPLLKNSQGYYLASKLRIKKIDWDKRILTHLKINQNITFHWNLALELIEPAQIKQLLKFSQQSIEAINQLIK